MEHVERIVNRQVRRGVLRLFVGSTLIIAFLGCSNYRATLVKLHIPRSYTGILVVVFNQSNGTTIVDADGSLTMQFDSQGIHASQLAEWPAKRNEIYYYLGLDNSLVPLPQFVRCRPNEYTHAIPQNTLGVCNGGDMYVTGGMRIRTAFYVVGPLNVLPELEKDHEESMKIVRARYGGKP